MWHTIELIVLHRVGFFDQVNCADNRIECGANQVSFFQSSWFVTIESILSRIESIFITIELILSRIKSVVSIESVYHNQVDFEQNRVDFYHNRVDFEKNRVDSGDAHIFWIDNFETNGLPYPLSGS